MNGQLEFTLLGSPDVRLGGEPLTGFRSAKAQALLYYLAVSEHGQSRMGLADLFWGQMGEHYARRNLNRTLSNLTQLVGDYLTVTRQLLALDRSQPYCLDVEALERAVTSAATGGAPGPLADALNLY